MFDEERGEINKRKWTSGGKRNKQESEYYLVSVGVGEAEQTFRCYFHFLS